MTLILPAAGAPAFSTHTLIDRLEEQLFARKRGLDGVPTLAEWATKKNLILEGFPIDFTTRPWLRQLYSDMHAEIVLRKATQIGGSVWAILAVLHKCDVIADWRGVVYFFPTKTDVNDFSQGRVKPLIDENPRLQEIVGDVDKVGMRQVAQSYLYFRGMRTKIGMKSVPADMVVFDELDEAPATAKAMAVERLAASQYKFKYELSNPSEPGLGIDLAFAGNPETGQRGSDERYWLLRCSACNADTCMELEFPRNIGEDDLRCLRPAKRYATRWKRALLDGTPIEEMGWYRACVKCGHELNPLQGQWVAARPTIETPHGYSLSQLYALTVAPCDIAYKYATTQQPRHFYNLNVGIGWVPSTDRLVMANVLRWCTEGPMLTHSTIPCTMGVDQGKDLHVVVSRPGPIANTRQIVLLAVLRDWDELDVLMERFHVERCVVDALPEQRNSRAFALRHRGRVFLNFYIDAQRGSPLWNEDQLTVTENRTESLDASRAPFHLDPATKKADESTNVPRVLLPRAFDVVTDFARHMVALIKKREENEDPTSLQYGAVRYVYVHGAGAPDHFAHAWNYDFLCWGADVTSVSRPGGDFSMAALGHGHVVTDDPVTNPEHPLFGLRRKLRIRGRG